jgi:hypothetical protein
VWRAYIFLMNINACILSLSICLALGASGSAHADDAPAIADGSTLIGIGGDVAMAGITGGMADPVPLFAGENGPAVFVMSVPSLGIDSDGLENRLNRTVKQGFAPPGTPVSPPFGAPR